MSREGRLVKNTLILALGTVVPKLTNFIFLPILTAYLTKLEYGTYDLICVLCSLFLPVVTLQIQTAAFRFLIEAKNNESAVNRIITNIWLFVIPVSLISLLILFFVLGSYSITTRLLISLYFFFDIIYSTSGQIARGLSDNKNFALGSVTSSLSNLFLVIIFVYGMKLGLNGVMIGMIASMALPAIILLKKTETLKKINFQLVDREEIRKLLSYSWPMVPNTMSMWVMNASDKLVISFFLGIEATAIYAVAGKIPNILTIAQSTFTMAWQESASLASDDSDADDYYTRMFDTVFCLMSGLMLLLMVALPILFKVLIKGDYIQSYYQVPILMLSMFFYSLSSYLGGIYVAAKKTRNVGLTTICAAVINILVDLLLINMVGLYAASISTLVSYIFLVAYRMLNVKTFAEIRYDFKKIVLVIGTLVIITFSIYSNNYIVLLISNMVSLIISYTLNKHVVKSFIRSASSRLRGKFVK